RTVRLLRLPGGEEIELALDRGSIVAEAGREPVAEAELELKRGAPAALFALARTLAEDLPIKVGRLSKSTRGFALGVASGPRPTYGGEVALEPEMSVGQAFAAVARGCLDQLHGNESALLAGDAAAVHQMRVALRRLRAAISLFGPAVRTAETETVLAEAKWL